MIDVPDASTRPELRVTTATTLLDWVASSEASPFTVHPPDSLIDSVQIVLLQDNTHHALEHVQARRNDLTTAQPGSRGDAKERGDEDRGWSVGPSQAWLQQRGL